MSIISEALEKFGPHPSPPIDDASLSWPEGEGTAEEPQEVFCSPCDLPIEDPTEATGAREPGKWWLDRFGLAMALVVLAGSGLIGAFFWAGQSHARVRVSPVVQPVQPSVAAVQAEAKRESPPVPVEPEARAAETEAVVADPRNPASAQEELPTGPVAVADPDGEETEAAVSRAQVLRLEPIAKLKVTHGPDSGPGRSAVSSDRTRRVRGVEAPLGEVQAPGFYVARATALPPGGTRPDRLLEVPVDGSRGDDGDEEILFEAVPTPEPGHRVEEGTGSRPGMGAEPAGARAEPAQTFRLEGIFWDSKRPMAIINDTIVEKGSRVGGGQVMRIERNWLDLSVKGRRLRLYP